jgi:hypothetical protein
MTFLTTPNGKKSDLNSTNTPLSGNAVFTGSAEDVSRYESICLTIKADDDSDNSGVRVEHGSDGTNWDYVDVYTYDSKKEFIKFVKIKCQYMRIVYNNGNGAQSLFRLQTLLRVGNVKTDKKSNADAFGRLRVSNPTTLIEINHLMGVNNTQETQLLAGGGASSLNANSPHVELDVTTSGDGCTRQSRMRGIYQPGKSQYILMTGVLNDNNNATGVVSRIGYFDDDDGMFFEHTGDGGSGDVYVVMRTSTSGTPTDTRIPQSEWNMDTMDGKGESGLTLDVSNTQIHFFDMEWLGVGRVRCGFIVRGEIHVVHEFYHANILTVPYIAMPSLPTRAYVRLLCLREVIT